MDYKSKEKVVVCPPPSKSSSGGGFNVWSFLATAVISTTIAGNIVNNVNNNNNNNNNNKNLDNQNNNNQNFFNNMNENMNENMVTMAMGRYLSTNNTWDWIKRSQRLKACVQKMVCNIANLNRKNNRTINRILSITSGLLVDDHLQLLEVDQILAASNHLDCTKFICFGFFVDERHL